VTPAEEAVLAAARAYRDAHARCLAVGLDPPDGIDMDAAGDALLTAASFLVDAPPAEAPTVATVRPWPDPEAYRALAPQVFVIKPLDPSKALPPETDLSSLFGVDFAGVLE